MPVINTAISGDAEKNVNVADFFFVKGVHGFRPSLDGPTFFRPIPEVDERGNVLPAVIEVTPDGPNASALIIESCIFGAGNKQTFTGLCREIDGSHRQIDQVFPSIYITLRSMENSGSLPPHLAQKISLYLAKKVVNGRTQQVIKRAVQCGFMQAVIYVHNGKKLKEPIIGGIMLPVSALAHLNKLLSEHPEASDLFDPVNGYLFEVSALKPDPMVGRNVPVYKIEPVQKMPLKHDPLKVWRAWNKTLLYYTREQLLRHAVRCYGKDIVAVVFPEVEGMQTAEQSSPPSSDVQVDRSAVLKDIIESDPGLQHVSIPRQPTPPASAPRPVASATAAPAKAAQTGKPAGKPLMQPENVANTYRELLDALSDDTSE